MCTDKASCSHCSNDMELGPEHTVWIKGEEIHDDGDASVHTCTLMDLMNDIASKIPAKWRSVGIQLGLPSTTLDSIQQENAGKPRACLDS